MEDESEQVLEINPRSDKGITLELTKACSLMESLTPFILPLDEFLEFQIEMISNLIEDIGKMSRLEDSSTAKIGRGENVPREEQPRTPYPEIKNPEHPEVLRVI